MIANFFNNAKPLNSVIFLVTLVCFFVLAQFNIDFKPFTIELLTLKLGSLLILATLFFVYRFVINRNKLTLINSYALLFICLSLGFFYTALADFKVLISQLFLALAFRRIYSLRSSLNIKEKIFDSSFLIAISSLFFFENSYFMLLVYVALFVFIRSNWYYFIIPIIGFLVPYFLIYVYSLGTDSFSYFDKITAISFSFNLGILSHIKFLVIIDILFLTGLIGYIRNTLKTTEFSNEFRALWELILAHFILATFLVFTSNSFGIEKGLYIIFPFGIIMANYLQTIGKKVLKELIVIGFLCLTLGSIIYNFVP